VTCPLPPPPKLLARIGDDDRQVCREAPLFGG